MKKEKILETIDDKLLVISPRDEECDMCVMLRINGTKVYYDGDEEAIIEMKDWNWSELEECEEFEENWFDTWCVWVYFELDEQNDSLISQWENECKPIHFSLIDETSDMTIEEYDKE